MSLLNRTSQLVGNVILGKISNPDHTNPQKIIEILNKILADETMLSLKTRNARWNISGEKFYDLFSIYDIQYKQLNDISEEISLHAQMQDGIKIGTITEFLSSSRLVEQPGIIPDAHQLLSDHESIIRYLRDDHKKCSVEYDDISTSQLLVSIIRQHEKMAWMLRSFIENETSDNKKPESS